LFEEVEFDVGLEAGVGFHDVLEGVGAFCGREGGCF
jgi:hypothetical protein